MEIESYLHQAARDVSGNGVERWEPAPAEICEAFAEDPTAAALFITLTEQDSVRTLSVAERAPEPPAQTVGALVKGPGSLDRDQKLSEQIFPLRIPAAMGASVAEALHTLMSAVLVPYFEASSSHGPTSPSVAMTRQKFSELELALLSLIRHTDVQMIDLQVPAALHDVARADTADTASLNTLQTTVNEWKRDIAAIARCDRDPATGTAMEELNFWYSMENALAHINSQLQRDDVRETLAVLERGKRFHATLNFPGDTGFHEAVDLVARYNVVLRDLPLPELIVATSIHDLSKALDAFFAHIAKKLRPSGYPIWRFLVLMEAVSRDLASTLRKILAKENLMVIHLVDFKQNVRHVAALFEAWDNHMPEITSLARDLIRKRAENFIPVRINAQHGTLQDRLNYILTFRTEHERLISALEDIAKADPDVNAPELISKISVAYSQMQLLNPLDTSSEGERAWNIAEAQYLATSYEAESTIGRLLRMRLAATTSATSMFRVLDNFNTLFDRPAIRGAIHEYQTRLLETVKEDVEELKRRVHQQYTATAVYQTVSLRDIPAVSGLVIWLNQVVARLDVLMDRVGTVLGPDWKSYTDGQQLYNDCKDFREKLNTKKIVGEWVSAWEAKRLSTGKVFTVKKGVLTVQFDEKSTSLFKEVRAFTSLGFHIPHSVGILASESKRIYPFAIRIREAVTRLNLVLKLIKDRPQVTRILAKYTNSVFTVIQRGANLEWTNFNKSTEDSMDYVSALEASVNTLESHASHAIGIDDHILECLNILATCVYSHESFSASTSDINSQLAKLAIGYSNVSQYTAQLNVQLVAILSKRCVQALVDWTHDFKTSAEKVKEHSLSLENQVITVFPDLEMSRAAFFSELESITAQIRVNLPSIGPCKEHLSLSTDVVEALAGSIKFLGFEMSKAHSYVAKWFEFQGLWDLKPEDLYQNIGKNIETWITLLNEIYKDRQLFNFGDDHQFFGSRLKVSFGKIYAFINSKYDAWQNTLIYHFADLGSTRALEFHAKCVKYRSELETASLKSTDPRYLTATVALLQNVREELSEGGKVLATLKDAQAILTRYRYRFPDNWIYMDQLDGTWQALKSISRRRDTELSRLLPTLTATIEKGFHALYERTASVVEKWQMEKPVSGSEDPEESLETLKRFSDLIKKELSTRDSLNSAAKALKMTPVLSGPLDDMLQEAEDLFSVWTAVNESCNSLASLENLRWSEASPRTIRASLKSIIDSGYLVPTRIRHYIAFKRVQKVVSDRLETIPILSDLKSDTLRPRHWARILTRVGGNVADSSEATLYLGEIWASGLLQHKEFIAAELEKAKGEHNIEEFLKASHARWNDFCLELISYRDKIKLIKNWPKLFANLEEQLQSFHTVQHSPYYPTFESEILDWARRLNKLKGLFDVWVEVQRQWTYLEGVFTAPNIRTILVSETTKFSAVNSELLAIMRLVQKNSHVLEVGKLSGISESINRISEQLNKLQKSLGDYFESERKKFGRFYFVGDDDLLEMLGQPDIRNIEKHLKKMFSGARLFIGGTQSSEAGSEIYRAAGVVSEQDERLVFEQPASGSSVIDFLRQVEQSCRTAMKREAKLAVETLDLSWPVPSNIIEWLTRPSQAALLAFRIRWTREIEASDIGQDYTDRLAEYDMLLSELASHALGDITRLQRRKIEVSITELVYQRTVLADLKTRFDWDKQLRYYLDAHSNSIQVKQAGATFDYGYEYHGVPQALVRTKLTEDMFLTMTQALDQQLGGAPFGPAGTGKTESVKALALALGKDVVVFCCDESFDFQAVTRLLFGICQTGSWACFDEFNRLDTSILSAVSVQVSAIERALKEKQDYVKLSGQKGLLDSSTALFVTMNPLYAGRNLLPDNMRKLFRSFGMASPNEEKIVEVTLYAQGFSEAKTLAGVIVPLFSELSAGLSHQKHYDWGLRALKAVLQLSGNLKRATLCDDRLAESSIVRRACEESIAPKLVQIDLLKFQRLVEKTFPGSGYQNDRQKHLLSQLSQFAAKLKLTASAPWIEKVAQLHRFMDLFRGIMLIGDAGSGKTMSYETLASLYEDEVVTYVIDAKILSKETLYGSLDSTTREWTDGVFTSTLRRVVENLRGESRKRHWVIFDGDVDPEWAENLNSLLDDNRILTLPSGERLPLPDKFQIIFEVKNLVSATPATVTRCGMIWFDHNLVEPAMMSESMLQAYSEHVPEEVDTSCYAEIVSEVVSLVKHVDWLSVLSFASTMDHIMDFSVSRALKSFWALLRAQSITANIGSQQFAGRAILYSLVWSLAGDCSIFERKRLSMQLKDIVPALGQYINDDNDVFDFNISSVSGEWTPWAEYVEHVDLDPQSVTLPNLVIPTEDTVKHEMLLHQFILSHQPVILCGPPGSGKTMTLLCALRKAETFDVVSLNFSKASSPETVIRALEQYCTYSKTPDGVVMEPSQVGRWVVLFCDEINLPACDKYGTQHVTALLRGMIGRGGFWKDKQWVILRRVQFVGACNPPTDVGRLPLDSRFLRHCAVISVGHPSEKSLFQVYETIVLGILKYFPHLRKFSVALTHSMIEVYHKSRDLFSAKSDYYVYSPRELTRWCRGLFEAIKERSNIESDELVRLWAYEGLRLFADRLRLPEDRRWTRELIQQVAQNHFTNIDVVTALQPPILYSSWLTKEYQPTDKLALREFFSARVKTFNEEVVASPLTLFDDFMEHALRIDRVLRQPQGHMMLIGPSSSGKTTLTRFVCWMNGITVFQLNTFKGYSDSDFSEDLRTVLIEAGARGNKTCFIIDESNLLESSFVERMNSLLANSEVPGLFEGEDLSKLLKTCKEEAAHFGQNLSDTDDLLAWFSSQIMSHLHVVFTINSPDSDEAASAATSPALFSRCVLNWMGDWNKKSLFQVARDQLSLIDFGSISKDSLCEVLALTHRNVLTSSTSLSITPGHYISFLRHFHKLFQVNCSELEQEQRHFFVGIEKLQGSLLEVRALKNQLAEKRKELEAKNEQSNATLKQMLSDQSEAERKKEASIAIRSALEIQNAEIKQRKDAVYQDLELAEPAVIEAQRGVSNIKKQHLNELRAFNNPPDAVKITLEAVCVLLGQKMGSWREVMQSVRSEEFIPNIVNFHNETQMTPQVLSVLQNRYMRLPNFNFQSVNRASKACGPLLQWVLAQISYAVVLSKVGPLKKEVTVLEAAAHEKQVQENTINEMIDELEQSITRYQSEYADLVAQAQTIKSEMTSVETRVTRSVHLINSLGSEKDRWSASVKEFKDKKAVVLGNSILGGAFLAYAGYFDPRERRSMVDEWCLLLEKKQIEFTDNLSISNFLSSGAQRSSWTENGLQTESTSLENAVILMRHDKTPLIIDPSGEAKQFLKSLFGAQKLKTTSFLDVSFPKHLESAVRFGTTLLIENAEQLDPLIMPLLNREFTNKGGRKLVTLGRQEIDWSPHCLIFLVTQDPQVYLPQHVSSRTTVVNFTVTQSGMELSAVDKTMAKKRPDLQLERRNLSKLRSGYMLQLHSLEVELLEALNQSNGQLLEDASLLVTLENLKKEAHEVSIKAKNAKDAVEHIDRAIKEYDPIGKHAGKVFNLLDHLWMINNSYQFALSLFWDVFSKAISTSGDVNDVLRALYVETYNAVAPSLMLSDRPAFLLTLMVLFESADDYKNVLKEQVTLGTVPAGTVPAQSHIWHASQHLFKAPMRLESLEQDWVNIFNETSAQTPLMIQTVGADPSSRVMALGVHLKKPLKVIALGSDESQVEATRALEFARREGTWLLIQNLHMAPGWINELTGLLDNSQKTHTDTRIIFTTELGNQNVPITILRTCRLLCVEKPRGVGASLRECLTIFGPEMRAEPVERGRIYLSTGWVHSVIQERLISQNPEERAVFTDTDVSGIAYIIEKQLQQFSHRTNVDPNLLPWEPIISLLFTTIYRSKLGDEEIVSVMNLMQRALSSAIFEPGFEYVPGDPRTQPPEDERADLLIRWADRLPAADTGDWLGLSTEIERANAERDMTRILNDVDSLMEFQ